MWPEDSLVSRFLHSRVPSRRQPGDHVGGLSGFSGVPRLLDRHSESNGFREREREKAISGGIWRPNQATSSTGCR